MPHPSNLSSLVGMVVAIGLAGSLPACHGNPHDQPPVHIINNMDSQQRFDAQERNDFFADHRAMRAPVDGTVARGFLKDNDHFYRGRGADGRLVDTLPPELAFDDALLDRGHKRYNIYCAPCHDEMGLGKGMAPKRAKFQVQPISYHDDKFRAMPLGHFFDVISKGKGTMLSYAAQIPERDRWAIAAWVRTLQIHGKRKGWNPAPAPGGTAP